MFFILLIICHLRCYETFRLCISQKRFRFYVKTNFSGLFGYCLSNYDKRITVYCNFKINQSIFCRYCVFDSNKFFG